MATELLRRLFTVVEYHRMVEAGILRADDRLELIQGEIIQMSPIGRRHAACVSRLNRLFHGILGDRILLGIQNPIDLGSASEPQPDVTLLVPKPDCYESGHPQPPDIYLLIEVADTTIEFDRDVKLPLYAKASIPEVWLVDINSQCVEVYRQPNAVEYQSVQVLERGQVATIQAFPAVAIEINEILG